MKLSAIAKKVLCQGTDDWVPMAEVASLARDVLHDASSTTVRQASLGAIQELQSNGYVRVGDVTRTGFVPWAQSPQESLERIEREWVALGVPRLGDIGWLENTALGREIGLDVAKRSR
jgi:hypothetical protein